MTQVLSRPRRFRRVRRVAGACLWPIVRRAARAYVAGEKLEDALRVAGRFAKEGAPCALGYFDSEEEDTAQTVLNTYLSALRAIEGREDYLSIKLPALRFRGDLLRQVAEEAKRGKVRLHFDALWPGAVDQTREMIDELRSGGGVGELGFTLPGRWRRSLVDAHWAAARGLPIRVVKGQWEDPKEPGRDLRRGFLEVIDQLAGRAKHVAVASHDVLVAREAIQRLRGAGTACELELLFGFPMRESMAMAREMGVGVRVYIPYGKTHLPYAVEKLLGQPRLAWWLLKDLVCSMGRGWGKRSRERETEMVHKSPRISTNRG